MRRGFTLIELMVVAGIMAFLGTAAVGGYNAFQRGMAERGATGAASSFLKAAKERANVDRSPTMVVCFNRLLREADPTGDENAVVVGEAVAIRRAGRITYVNGTTVADEFADILGSYDVVEGSEIQERGGMRLWQFPDLQQSDVKYAVVADAATPLLDDVQLKTYEGWAFGEDSQVGHDANIEFDRQTPNAGETKIVTRSGTMKSLVYAFRILDQNGTSWKVGSGYGFEFARVQLPHNFIFDGDIPNTVEEVKQVKVMYFGSGGSSDQNVTVYPCMPDGSGKPKRMTSPAGVATSKGNTKI